MKHLLNFIIERMTRVLLQLWLMGKTSAVPHLSWTQVPLGTSICASTLKGLLQYWGQTNILNQLKVVVCLVWNGGETGHQTSCLLHGNPMEVGGPSTNTTTTSHWVFRMATWFTISALQPILAVLLTSVLMVCYFFQLYLAKLIRPTGSRIALVTQTNTCHKLSIFDVRVEASKLATELTISGIPHGKDVEHLKFDPSGEYLAVGRSDNIVQIFDTRMGSNLHTLHHGESISMKPPNERYGITAMEWVVGWHGRGVRLLTGGEDGEWPMIISPMHTLDWLLGRVCANVGHCTAGD